MIVAAVLVGMTLVPAQGVPAQDALDTENCTTHAEYDLTEVLMTPVTIESIYDVFGQYVDTENPDTFARTYRTCWAPDTREIIVRYYEDSRLSINWNVRDK